MPRYYKVNNCSECPNMLKTPFGGAICYILRVNVDKPISIQNVHCQTHPATPNKVINLTVSRPQVITMLDGCLCHVNQMRLHGQRTKLEARNGME